jgi:acyl-coenzyme A thioesterase PaaI-like protein
MMDVPNGYVAMTQAGAFAQANGPLYVRSSDMTLGFRVAAGHHNPVDMCHGGWLGTFLYMQMPISALHARGITDRFLVTVSLSLDFLAAAEVGSWIEGQATVLRHSNNLVFIQGGVRR